MLTFSASIYMNYWMLGVGGASGMVFIVLCERSLRVLGRLVNLVMCLY